MKDNKDENNEIFLEAFDESHSAVKLIHERLKRLGHNAEIPPHKRSATRAEAMDCIDNGDILVNDRYEVKRRGFNFTCAADFGEHGKRYADFFVCATHAWDNAKTKPFCFYILSRDGQYAGIVQGKDRKHWKIRKNVRDGRRTDNYRQDFYCSPLNFVHFISLKDEAEAA